MSLDYNIANVKEYEKLNEHELYDACMTLMLMGVSAVAVGTLPTIETRYEFLRMVGIAGIESRINWPRFVGLTTNVTSMTDAGFKKRHVDNLWLEANHKARHLAYMRDIQEAKTDGVR